MNKTLSLTVTAILLVGLVLLLSLTPSLNAEPAVQYTTDYTRFNNGGGITSTASYTIQDEINIVGLTLETQSSGSYSITAPSFEEIIAATPSNTKNWKDYH